MFYFFLALGASSEIFCFTQPSLKSAVWAGHTVCCKQQVQIKAKPVFLVQPKPQGA